MTAIFRNKYVSWILSILFITSIIFNEILNTSTCWILFTIELLCIYSFGYYAIENYRTKFSDRFIVFYLGVSGITSIVFLISIINCQY
jgi:hypothetical protein